eukprot:SAG22_NODE_4156_length_1365_cov_2.436019_2_plen_306_part_00
MQYAWGTCANLTESEFDVDDSRVQAELNRLTAALQHISGLLRSTAAGGAARVTVGAYLLDAEKFRCINLTTGWPLTPHSVQCRAVQKKHSDIASIVLRANPTARVEWYNRGAVQRYCPLPLEAAGWCPTYLFGGVDNVSTAGPEVIQSRPGFSSFGTCLYNLPEVGYMRETFTRTVFAANEANVSGQLTGGVTPWIALGCGTRMRANRTLPGTDERRLSWNSLFFDFQYDYDRATSWQLGAELNIPFFSTRPEVYAPWDAAQAVAMYPSIFDTRQANNSAGRAPSMVEHFAAYVRGAANIDGAEP